MLTSFLMRPATLLRRAAVPCTLVVALLSSGCAYLEDMFRQKPTALLPAQDLYQAGEEEMNKRTYPRAGTIPQKTGERHPQRKSAARARSLVGETYYREGTFEKAIKEFEAFMAFYPRHEIADLVQYRLAMSYYDQMKPVDQDQGLTVKDLEQFKKLGRDDLDTPCA